MSRNTRLRLEIMLILLATAGWAALTSVPMAIFTLVGGIIAALLFVPLAILLCAVYPLLRYGRINTKWSLKDFLWDT